MLDAQGQHLPLDQGALDVVVLTAPNIAREIITITTLYVKSVRQIMETICFLIQAGVYFMQNTMVGWDGRWRKNEKLRVRGKK